MFTEHDSIVSVYQPSSGTLRTLEKIYPCIQVVEATLWRVFSPPGF